MCPPGGRAATDSCPVDEDDKDVGHQATEAATSSDVAYPEPPDSSQEGEQDIDSPTEFYVVDGNSPTGETRRVMQEEMLFAGRKATAFLATAHEKLRYQLSMFGLPVGSAVLEAVNKDGEIRLSMTAQSNAVISRIYPVADYAETRLIGGEYIVSNFRQHEGRFHGDTGFALCLSQQNVLWTDRLTRVVTNSHLDDRDVLDIISAFYYLRNQPLEVGKVVRLRIYDHQKIVDAPVEVLRRERTKLPGFREEDTLVVRPGLPSDGLFRRSGELLVWLTDDQYKVPVRMETSISLGKVTAELISAEAERPPLEFPQARGSNRKD